MNLNSTLEKSLITAKGEHLFTICNARSTEAQKLSELIEGVRFKREAFLRSSNFLNKVKEDRILRELWQEYRFFVEQLHKKFKLREVLVKNITTTAGRNVLARRLSGNTTYTGIVNYTALGTSNTAPAVSDTQLGTETYRKALSSGTYASNIAYLETFFTASEVSGTFQEYGNFIDGSGTANSGQLFNRFIQTVTKSITETLNVQSTVTFADA